MSSSPLFSSNQIEVLEAVADGDVKISSAQGTAQLIFNPTTGYYELKTNTYPIVPGLVYKMTVTTINGDVATAETQVPHTAVPINTVTVETGTENNQTSDVIKVSFTDEPDRANYYRIAALHAFAKTLQADTIEDETRIKELYSDLNHDGEKVSLSVRFLLGDHHPENYSNEYYDVFLYNCSESYYNFNKSLKNYSGNDISFPPQAESTLMYTNVKGGFGCFGAYTRSMLRCKKK
jgi:NADH dehydrogenase/NADH:ubiquinone oxidoreductase subunit G